MILVIVPLVMGLGRLAQRSCNAVELNPRLHIRQSPTLRTRNSDMASAELHVSHITHGKMKYGSVHVLLRDEEVSYDTLLDGDSGAKVDLEDVSAKDSTRLTGTRSSGCPISAYVLAWLFNTRTSDFHGP